MMVEQMVPRQKSRGHRSLKATNENWRDYQKYVIILKEVLYNGWFGKN